ncbi:MAG: S53 family peptidase, partial [Nocardioides sp.]
MNRLPLRSRAVALVAVVAATSAFGVAGASAASGADPSITPHRIKVDPDIHRVNINPDAATFSCQTRPIDGSAGPRCYTPAQIQAAYGASSLLAHGKDGTGRTIVVIDAYSNPYLDTDLSIFDSTFGLPAAKFTSIAPQGVPAFDINDGNAVGWAEEETLDVLWAHAMAPGAKIVLVEASSNQDVDLYNATKYAVDHNLGDVISQSFGEAETCMDPTLLAQQHRLFDKASRQGMTLFASSGDSGAAQFSCDGSAAVESASTPASDPLVTGVGGTTLNADGSTGAYLGETAWTETLFGCNPPAVDLADVGCSGGGISTVYHKPLYQVADVRGSGRGVPDVAYNAGVNGGVLTHCAVCNLTIGLDPTDPVFFLFGGTSSGSPQWAAITAITDQVAHRRLGTINPALYALSHLGARSNPLHDVTTGDNRVVEIGGAGFDARSHWDAVTGLGTPDAARL